MAQKIGIGVEAQLDASTIEQQINALGQKIAQANKVQFTPVSVKSTQDVESMVKRYEQLLKVHGELNRRVKATGQSGKAPWDLDFSAMFPDESSRNRQIQKVLQYTAGGAFQAQAPSAPQPGQSGAGGGGGGGGGPQGPSWQGTAAQVASAGLRAAGPVGGVVANSVGTGMSAGFGAGLMGLLGGMLALGVGKLVSGVMEKIGEAESNNIAMDRLKRTLGDVNVSFNALKSVLHAGADNLKITYAESEKLATQFAKLGNVTGSQYRDLSDELGVGVGMSRAFGLDPSQGVGVMGQMRGLGITSSTQESRRFALLIGETIGKAGAFAKADEMMESVASFAASQTRNNMSEANVAGYAGMFSSMVGSGIPGLDPQGAASLLARINSTLSAGGAKGEASQFFTALVGNDLGLDPVQTQILREGGAFATNDKVFGKRSAYSRYMGEEGPGGDQTVLQATIDRLKKQRFASDDKQDKLLRAQAAANHLGVNVSQAMAMLSLEPNAMGEMQKRFGNLSEFSENGIGNMATAMYGKSDDVQALARSMKARKDVTDTDRKAITDAEGNESKLRDVLADLSAKYGQERTQGSDIRDSKNALDNIKTSIADRLVPYAQAMRDGILYLAGGKNQSRLDVMKAIEGTESKGRQAEIDRESEDRIKAANAERAAASKAVKDLYATNRPKVLSGEMSVEEHRRQMDPLLKKEAEVMKKYTDALDWKAEALKKERDLTEKNLKKLEESDSAERKINSGIPGVDGSKPTAGVTGYPSVDRALERANAPRPAQPGKDYTSPGAGGSLDTSGLDEKLAAAERANGLPPGTLSAVMQQEIGGRKEFLEDPSKYHYGLNAQGKRVAPHTGQISTAFGPFGILESTGKRPGFGVSPLKDKSIDEQIRFAAEYLAARSRSAGSLEGGLAGYGEGSGYSNSVTRRMRNGTPMPDKVPSSANNDQRFIFDAPPIEVIHRNERGDIMQTAQLSGEWKRANPFGTERYA